MEWSKRKGGVSERQPQGVRQQEPYQYSFNVLHSGTLLFFSKPLFFSTFSALLRRQIWVLGINHLCLGCVANRSVHPTCLSKSKKKRLTHASKLSLSSAVQLSFDRSVGSCCEWPIDPEPVKGIMANSSSRHCIDRFWFGRFLATVTGRGPL